MTISVVVFGAKQAGKSTFIHQIKPKRATESASSNTAHSQLKTDPFEYVHIARTSNSPAWDTWIMHDTQSQGATLPTYYKPANLGIYCVDLTKEENEQEIKKEIIKFRKCNPKAPLILVGTKKDLCEGAEEKIAAIHNTIQGQLDREIIEGFAGYTTVSQDDNALADFFPWAESIVAKKVPQTCLLLKARNTLPTNSLLYQALDQFILIAEELNLSTEQFDRLGEEARNLLLNGLKEEDIARRGAAIEKFAKNCHDILKDEPSKLKKAIDAIVAAALVTFFAFVIGFTLGCAAGVWTGPFALLTGIATGSAAAVTLLTVSGTCGAAAGALSAFGFFREAPVTSTAINGVVEAAKAYTA
ncbi:GTPase domain-containing protein [Legionella maceachernii]|uniref:Rho GTPase (Miro-like) n=1 Tax=Legionella maceachernii TaxID=466 RepID=A0A0W0W0I0_9GAMM|nr:Rab family GTPase [Legionella maceachernii]KTD25741.1 Rho GTPase (Miro-like) [Legionella maceachernii]SJZ92503.1 GTPase SAR1 family protein [Legionella maceachernii]SUP03535.1 Miro-like protein [Legionella maceachernii]